MLVSGLNMTGTAGGGGIGEQSSIGSGGWEWALPPDLANASPAIPPAMRPD